LCPSIELSNVCNLNCPYCYVETTDSPTKQRYPDQLTLAELERVVKSLAEAGARTINITGAGEPTMDPVFERVVRLIASLGIRPLVATNGIKLGTSTEMVRLFVETRASVVFLLPCSAPQN
jgi:MoaA/NifB/PqqE/SkfB family radical SAM enzyme